MVGENGITDNAKKAKYLVVVKKINDTIYKRLDYNFAGPVIRRASYKDSLLKILHSPYADYKATGYTDSGGKYQLSLPLMKNV
jgi:hypothetical protein